MARIIVDKQPRPVTGPWTLADLRAGKLGYPKNKLKVFTCFHCGGGSSMGYKLAGFDVIGGVEIDSDMMRIYRQNHSPNPELSYQMPIQDFPAMNKDTLPKELFDLDVLDGSPPCSSFSMAGSREDGWNEKKMFREGQTEQVLDDLFFHFIKVADMLRPKIVVAENVKGLVIGKARGYVKEIFKAYSAAGYDTQLFLLNSSRMGVPQARERTFFVSRRRDLDIPKFKMEFSEDLISYANALGGESDEGKPLSEEQAGLWRRTPRGKSLAAAHPKGNMFTWTKLSPSKPAGTATSGPAQLSPFHPTHINDFAQRRIQSFPDDYDFLDQKVRYVCGMSVPPLMMQRVALEVARALLGL